MRHIVIAYHDKCNDGYCAAAIAANALMKEGVSLHFVEAVYGQPLQRDIAEILNHLEKSKETLERIFILDFCPEAIQTRALDELGIKTVIIDHHKSAKAVMSKDYKNISTIYSEDYSAALRTWMYFNAATAKPPKVVANVSDRDLWKFDLPNTKEFHAGVLANPNREDIAFWVELLLESPTSERMYYDLCWAGKTILDYQDTLFKSMVQTCGKIVKPVVRYPNEEEIGGINIKVINHIGMYHGFCEPSLVSDFSDYIKKELEVNLVCLYSLDPNSNGYIYSVRSGDSPNQITARDLAEYFGGGGHDKAAGFEIATLLTD